MLWTERGEGEDTGEKKVRRPRPRARVAWAQAGAVLTAPGRAEGPGPSKRRAFPTALPLVTKGMSLLTPVSEGYLHIGGNAGGSTTNRSHAVVRAPGSALAAGDTRAKRTQAGGRGRGTRRSARRRAAGWGSSGTPLPLSMCPGIGGRGTIWNGLETSKPMLAPKNEHTHIAPPSISFTPVQLTSS